jgi:uncharacterized membrane protein
MTFAEKARGLVELFTDITWFDLKEFLKVILEKIGLTVGAILLAIFAIADWFVYTAATAAIRATIWFVVWAIGLAVTVNLFVNYSGFKFTKLMEWLS